MHPSDLGLALGVTVGVVAVLGPYTAQCSAAAKEGVGIIRRLATRGQAALLRYAAVLGGGCLIGRATDLSRIVTLRLMRAGVLGIAAGLKRRATLRSMLANREHRRQCGGHHRRI